MKNLVDKNKALAVVSFQRPPDMKYQQLKQICKALIAEKGHIKVIESPQKELFEDMIDYLQKKYDSANPPPVSSLAASSKRPAEFETVEVPTNPMKRLKFHADETSKIAQMLASSLSMSFGLPGSAEPVVPQAFALILDDLSG